MLRLNIIKDGAWLLHKTDIMKVSIQTMEKWLMDSLIQLITPIICMIVMAAVHNNLAKIIYDNIRTTRPDQNIYSKQQ